MPGIEKMAYRRFVGAGFDRDRAAVACSVLLAHDAKHVTDELVEERCNVLQTQPEGCARYAHGRSST